MKKMLAQVRFRFKSVAVPFAFAAVMLILSSTSARADDFTFAFSNNVGTVSGTVTGEILGLTNNSTGSAAQVIITSFPVGLNSVLGSGPIDATAWDQQIQNVFTEANGAIIGAAFWSQLTFNSDPYGGQLYINAFKGSDFVNVDGVDLSYIYTTGFSAVTFAPLASPVPEPSSLLLLATGLAGAAGAYRCKLGL